MNNTQKVSIKGYFDESTIAKNSNTDSKAYDVKPSPKHMIHPHPGFELIEADDGTVAKLAYGKFYYREVSDLDIELDQISLLEPLLDKINIRNRDQVIRKLKFHYKKAISIISPTYSAGWNRWSDYILEIFLSNKKHKIVWGSGNCGKSAIMALCLYTKWRVNPTGRMVVIASRVVADAGARVFGYIQKIHSKAPSCTDIRINLVNNQKIKGIFCQLHKDGKWVDDEQACIVSLPVKVNLNTADIGSNLLGKHPSDRLIIAFDEAQELPATMATDAIFLNWYTNPRLDIVAWGNPRLVQYHSPDTHDLLFKLGSEKLSLQSLKRKEKESHKTTVWSWRDTVVLHLSMLDSPKDDPDEINYYVPQANGLKVQRLEFLAGRDSVKTIAEHASPNSPAWYSQVLGFPFIDTTGSKQETVLSGFIISNTRDYPLRWRTPENQLEWFMGVDPSVSGTYDPASIVCGRMGTMVDGRLGIDVVNGRYCKTLVGAKGDTENFTDTIIETMWSLSQKLGIPLKNIAIETHSAGEVLRYALNRHIEAGKWAMDAEQGQFPLIVNPTISPTERSLFKTLGNMVPAKEMCADIMTEYWVAVRCAVQTRQIFNIPDNILKQFYNRYLLRNANGTKYKIESKDAMSNRGVRSPNDGDALANMLEVMRRRGKFGYVFYDRNKYSEVYGENYDNRKSQEVINQRLGIVSRLLNLETNLATYADPKYTSTRGPVKKTIKYVNSI